MEPGKYVIVALGKELYGIPVMEVETILGNQNPVRMPKTSKMLLGVFELRGRTLPALDLRMRLDLPQREGDANFVVIQSPNGPVSLRVDSVVGISTFDEGELEASSSLVTAEEDGFLAGIAKQGDKLYALLNPKNIVPLSLRGQVSKVAQAA